MRREVGIDMPGLVNELVQQKVDVIVAVNNVIIRAAKEATKTIPIVMISSVDPVNAGYVDSFAHPGGNITGLTTIGASIRARSAWSCLKELLPEMSRIAVLSADVDARGQPSLFKEYEAATRAFKIELRSLAIRGPNS